MGLILVLQTVKTHLVSLGSAAMMPSPLAIVDKIILYPYSQFYTSVSINPKEATMDIEFHYYMTYLIAAKAGFDHDDAQTIAYASQYVDDNDMEFVINKDQTGEFANDISQTMNILKPKRERLEIYPIFHFIPGNPLADSADRLDGSLHWLTCTPGNDNARELFNRALDSGSLHRLGIAIHAFADTWAHQNFTGSFNDYNGIYCEDLFTVGHAQAGHNPDEPALIWKDPRLIQGRVDNRARFLDAAEHILRALLDHKQPDLSTEERDGLVAELRTDLDWAIGKTDQRNEFGKQRIQRYMELAEKPAYNGHSLLKYNEDTWFDDAIHEDVRMLCDRKASNLLRFDPWTDQYTWKQDIDHRETDWYQFQTAVKEHLASAKEVLGEKNMEYLQHTSRPEA